MPQKKWKVQILWTVSPLPCKENLLIMVTVTVRAIELDTSTLVPCCTTSFHFSFLY